MKKQIHSRRRPTEFDAAATEETPNNETAPDSVTPDEPVEAKLSSETDPQTAKRVKYKVMLYFEIQGKTQIEIAKLFNTTTRTKRNWKVQANKLGIHLELKVDALKEFCARYGTFKAEEIELIEWNRQAEKDGDHKMKLSYAKELRKLRTERDKWLNDRGVYAGFLFPSNKSEDNDESEANLIMSLFGDLITIQDLDDGGDNDPSS